MGKPTSASDRRRPGPVRPQLPARREQNLDAKINARTFRASRIGAQRNLFIVSADQGANSAIAGNRTEWEQLIKKFGPRLYRTAFSVLRNKEDAEDALQQTWLNAFTHFKSFEGRSSFSTWLTRIAINSALMIHRKNRQAQNVSMEEMDEGTSFSSQPTFADRSPNPEESYADTEQKLILHRAISSLSPPLRNAIEFGPLQERSNDEMARRLGLSTGTVKARLFRARAALGRDPSLKKMSRQAAHAA